MIHKKLLDTDPTTGTQTWHYYDDSTDETHIETVQDLEPLKEFNKFLQNDGSYSQKGIKNEMWHYAKIPVVKQMEFKSKFGFDVYESLKDPEKRKKFFRWLNDPDNRYLKVTGGYHGG